MTWAVLAKFAKFVLGTPKRCAIYKEYMLVLFEKTNYNNMRRDYMTLKEAGEKWGVTPRWINYYCSAGRIPGAVKMGTVWLIPKSAQKPVDGRTKQGKEQKHE